MADPMSVVLCLPEGMKLFDPGPDGTESRQLTLTSAWDQHVGGVVGWSSGGWAALELAAAHPDLPRLAILSLPYPDDEAPPLNVELDAVRAKTLLLFGSKDPQTGSKHGRAWQKRLQDARLEMVPGADHNILEQMWSRVVSHLGPGRTRT